MDTNSKSSRDEFSSNTSDLNKLMKIWTGLFFNQKVVEAFI